MQARSGTPHAPVAMPLLLLLAAHARPQAVALGSCV